MKHVVLLTHGRLCEGFASALQVISGMENSLTLISMEAQDSPETMTQRVKQVLDSFPAEDPLILMTDIPVGSTTQIAIPFLETFPNLYILTGLNLGLLLEITLNPMEGDISAILREAVEASRQTLLFINDQLDSNEE
ncbi:hypothetical protein [Holdemania massiliensis]|uniref:PTS sugar transporter subunit IIA domain-containing protein n=1 Tax=Holdemania massiliensis TaxID=1468449 RepID=UPI001F056BD9|nr:hypothetical protein [Holdemania massiliensis]MCH1941739.1 hypothetical protein [Holdemania massiliensis]